MYTFPHLGVVHKLVSHQESIGKVVHGTARGKEKKRGVEDFMVRLKALFLLFALKEDFHGLIFIFVFV